MKGSRRPDASIPGQIHCLLQKLVRQLLLVYVLYYVVKVDACEQGILREASHRQRRVGVYLGLADLDHSSVRSNALPRSPQGFAYQGVQNNIDAITISGPHNPSGKTGVSAVEDVVSRDAILVYKELLFVVVSHGRKDLCPNHLRDLEGQLARASRC